MKKLWLSVLLAIVLTLSLGKVYFHSGFPYTHDGENHLARFANYKIALKEGQFPPRFAPNLFNHYGYPVFNYNYPLANIISLPFSILKVNYEVTFKIIAVTSIFCLLLFAQLWLQKLGFSQFQSMVTTVSLATTPYLINTIWFRGNIGEILILGLAVVQLFLIELLRTSQKKPGLFLITALVWGMYFLSHNVAILLMTPFLLVYGTFRLFEQKKKFFSFLVQFCIGILLSVWFWLPALLEKSEIILGGADVNTKVAAHFPTVSQLVSSPLQFGFSLPGSIDTLSFGLGIVSWIALLLVVIRLSQRVISQRLSKVSKFEKSSLEGVVALHLGISLLLIVLMLPVSSLIWKSVSITQFIQFPWRLSSVFAISILPVVAWAISKQRKIDILLILIALTQIIVLSRLAAVDYFHKTLIDYDAFSQSTSTNNENLPVTFTYQNIADWQPGPSIFSGEATVQVESWSGTEHRYQLDVTSSAVVVEPTMYFLGWETKLNSNPVAYLDNESIQGRIAYAVEPGTYQVITRFTQNTPARLIGNTISLVTFVVVFGVSGVVLLKNVLKAKQK